MPIVRRAATLSWVIALGSALAAVGCGNKSSAPDSTASGGSDSPDGSSSAAAGKTGGSGDAGSASTASGDCPTGSFNLLFSPAYSAYDGGAHDYQVPIYAPTVPDPTTLTWSASDPSMVKIESDPDTGGVMITTQSDGEVDIIARDGAGACGVTKLTITKASADDWKAGSDRYHSGTLINRLPRGGYQMRGAAGAGAGGETGMGPDAQCTSCHGSDATSGPYKTVEHTPYQTGGFSDDDLLDIIQNGKVPTTGSCAPAKGQTGPSTACFDPSVVPYALWQSFHKWSIGDSPEALVIYLRSLTPVLTQSGTQNLGGGFMGGGGAGGRGGRPNGGAGGRPNGGAGGRAGGGGTGETSGAGGSTGGTGGASTAGGGTSGASTAGTGGDSGGAPSGGIEGA